jgi:hypothetical protein
VLVTTVLADLHKGLESFYSDTQVLASQRALLDHSFELLDASFFQRGSNGIEHILKTSK